MENSLTKINQQLGVRTWERIRNVSVLSATEGKNEPAAHTWQAFASIALLFSQIFFCRLALKEKTTKSFPSLRDYLSHSTASSRCHAFSPPQDIVYPVHRQRERENDERIRNVSVLSATVSWRVREMGAFLRDWFKRDGNFFSPTRLEGKND